MKDLRKPLRCENWDANKGDVCNALILEHYVQGKDGELIFKCRKCKKYTVLMPYF